MLGLDMIGVWCQAPDWWLKNYGHDPLWMVFSNPVKSMMVRYIKKDYDKELQQALDAKTAFEPAKLDYVLDSVALGIHDNYLGIKEGPLIPDSVIVDDEAGKKRARFLMDYARTLFEHGPVMMQATGTNISQVDDRYNFSDGMDLSDLTNNIFNMRIAQTLNEMKDAGISTRSAGEEQDDTIIQADLFDNDMMLAWCKAPIWLRGYKNNPLWFVFETIGNKKIALKYIKKDYEQKKKEAEKNKKEFHIEDLEYVLEGVGINGPEEKKTKFQYFERIFKNISKAIGISSKEDEDEMTRLVVHIAELCLGGCIILKAKGDYVHDGEFIKLQDGNIEGFCIDMNRVIDHYIKHKI